LFLAKLPRRKELVVLDAGCGNARNSIEIARRASVARVIGVDVSKEMLARARERVKAAGLSKLVRLVKADFAVRVPLPAASVDAAFYLASLHHLKKSQQSNAFAELSRVVKPGGLVFVSVWNKAQRKFLEKRAKQFFVSWNKKSGERVKRFHYFFERGELEALGERCGFEVADSFFESGGARVALAAGTEAKNLCVVFRKLAISKTE